VSDATAPGAPLLQLEDLTTTFATPRGPLRAVDAVSFEVGRGETIGIVGESGSGKSVLVRSVMDLLPRTATVAGRVVFDGRDIRDMPQRDRRHLWGREIAMIFQDPMTSLNPVKTVGRQITDPIRHHLRLSRKAARLRAMELLALVHVPDPARRLTQYPHELSGGMRQRVMIAIAVSCSPKLLIADEPTTALDVTVQRQILDLIGALQHEMGMSVILITHDLGVVAGRTKRVLVMYAGQVVEEGGTSVLFEDVRHPYTEALLTSIPKVDLPSQTRLSAISGRPPDLVNPPPGCRFAARCRQSQARCVDERPRLQAELAGIGATSPSAHRFACFFPVGSSLAGVAREDGADVPPGGSSLGAEMWS
jgi:peptide/nickel transport system ATP-binding protein